MWARGFAALLILTLAVGCGDDGGGDDSNGPTDGVTLTNGCASWDLPQAQPGDPIDGDTYTTFAAPLFNNFCTRCHASTRVGDERNGAPEGFDWDIEASVRAELPRIRSAVGVANFMPLNAPLLSCEQRLRLVRWIDAGAP